MEAIFSLVVVLSPWIGAFIIANKTPKGFSTFLPQTIITFFVVIVLFFIGLSYPAGDYGSKTGMGFMFFAVIVYFASAIILLFRMIRLSKKHKKESRVTNSDVLDN